MRFLDAYRMAWKLLWGHKKMWLLLYVCNVLFALVAVLPLQRFLNSELGHSLAIGQSLGDFDYTFLMDVLNEYGGSISLILNQAFVIVGLYWLFSVFLKGGILEKLVGYLKGENEVSFWSGCGKYFFRLFRLAVYFGILQGGLLFLMWMLFQSISGGLSPFELESDRDWVNTFKILMPIYGFLAMVLLMLHDYAKVFVVKLDKTLLFRPIWMTFKTVLGSFVSCLLLYLLNVLTFLVVFGLYYFFQQGMVTTTDAFILLAFLVGQLFVFGRLGVRLLNLGSVVAWQWEQESTKLFNNDRVI